MSLLHKRSGADGDEVDRSGEMAALETARSATESSGDREPEPKKEEEHISLFWRVFGGTILSIVALVSITLYNSLSSSITELRTALSHEREARTEELGREREARAQLVKKDEFNTRVTAQYERMRGIDSVKVELEGLKEKVNTNATAMETVKRDAGTTADVMKKDAAALEILKERVALLESIKKDIAGLEAIKEKVVTACGDLKATREEVQKISAEVERNKSSDLERKTVRDSQHKQLEDAIKELQKGLQDCREKLARLEGALPKVPPEAPTPGTRPSAGNPKE